jgi:hypothetical protein
MIYVSGNEKKVSTVISCSRIVLSFMADRTANTASTRDEKSKRGEESFFLILAE